MLHISTQKLIEKLLERTQNGTIDWKERVPDGVVLDTEGYVVELTDAPINMRLLQGNGRLLENVTEEILASAKNEDGRQFDDIVRELLGEAERFAKGTEQAIASILDAVESSNTPVLKKRPLAEEQVEAPPSTEMSSTEASVSPTELPTAFEGSPDNPETEAGMNAAVSKMVAEINGEPEEAGLPPLETPAVDILDPGSEDKTALDFSAPDFDEPIADIEPELEIPKIATPDISVEPTQEAADDDSLTSHAVSGSDDVSNGWIVSSSEGDVEDEILFVDDIPEEEAPLPPAPEPELPLNIAARDGGHVETAREELELPTLPSLDAIEASAIRDETAGKENDFDLPPPAIEDIPETPVAPDLDFADEVPDVEPMLEETPNPVETDAASSPLGFSFRSKVTATGLAIGGKIGTMVEGVPDDVKQRVDNHERSIKLQHEQTIAEKRAEEARSAADAAEEARSKSPIGFKSWS